METSTLQYGLPKLYLYLSRFLAHDARVQHDVDQLEGWDVTLGDHGIKRADRLVDPPTLSGSGKNGRFM